MVMIQNVVQNAAQKVTEKSAEGVGQAAEAAAKSPAQVNPADTEKFMNLMQQTKGGPVGPGQITGSAATSHAHGKTIGERILDGIAGTAQNQQVKYQDAMSKVMDAAKTGASPGDLLQAQVGLMKVETLQQAEGKVVSKVDQTIEGLLKGG